MRSLGVQRRRLDWPALPVRGVPFELVERDEETGAERVVRGDELRRVLERLERAAVVGDGGRPV